MNWLPWVVVCVAIVILVWAGSDDDFPGGAA